MLVADAIWAALDAHQGQVDKQDQPYIFHPLRVMELVRQQGGDDVAQAAAVLHDVLEDTEWTVSTVLAALGYSPDAKQVPEISNLGAEVASVLTLVTHVEGTSYRNYIDSIVLAVDPRPRLIKWADSTDNWARLPSIGDRDTRKRLQVRYELNFEDLGETPAMSRVRFAHRLHFS